MAAIHASDGPVRKGPFYTGIFFQTVMAMIIGGLLGYFFKGQPWIAEYMDPLGKAFIKLVKMIIAPVIFLTISIGIANMRDVGSLGRVAGKALGYFLFFSTLALIVGLIVGNVWRTGDGMNLDQSRISTSDASRVSSYSKQAHDTTVVGFLMHVIPDSFVGAFTGASTDPMTCAVDPKSVAGSTIKVGEDTVIDPKTLSGAKITCTPPSMNILQVVFVAVLFGVGLALSGKHGEPATRIMTAISDAVFKMVNVVMRAAPLGALGAFAFLISDVGIQTLVNLAQLVVAVYATSALFILLVLGAVAIWAGFSIFSLLRYLKEELFLVIATSSSESALPALMRKMEAAGCSRSVVGLVVPTGYSFNLDGTNIYMTLAALFLAQATNVHLSVEQQLLLLAIAMLSSKGAAGVTGAGFIALAATLEQFPVLPLWTMGFILGVDRFLSQCRSLTNFIGNAVATVVVSRWEGALDRNRLKAALASRPAPPLGAQPIEQDMD